MSRKRNLTSKDVDRFPNFLSGRITESAAATFTTTQIFTPIPRLKTSGNKATVMELLWVDMDMNTALNAAGEQAVIAFSIGSVPTVILPWNDPRAFYFRREEMMLLTSGAVLGTGTVRYDFQSKDGYGYLLASDSFHVSVEGTGLSTSIIGNWKMFYRFVDIPLSEFVGLVQSTQQS